MPRRGEGKKSNPNRFWSPSDALEGLQVSNAPKCLYLCFVVYKKDFSVAYSVQKIPMAMYVMAAGMGEQGEGLKSRDDSPSSSSLGMGEELRYDSPSSGEEGEGLKWRGDSPSSSSLSLHLKELCRLSGFNIPYGMRCGVLGTRIFFAGGMTGKYNRLTRSFVKYPAKKVYYLDTSALGGACIRRFPPFLAGKSQPMLVQQDGKLYALPGYAEPLHNTPSPPYFEVFDSRNGDWSPLREPPFFSALYFPRVKQMPTRLRFKEMPYPLRFNYIVVGHYLLAEASGIDRLFYLDLEDPHTKDWTHTPVSYSTGFDFGGTATTIVADVDKDGQDLVMLSYNFVRKPRDLVLQLISRNFEDYIKSNTNDDGVLSPICAIIPNVVPDYVKLPVGNEGCNSRLLHLEGRKFCLIISSFEGPATSYAWDGIPQMSLYSICFELNAVMTPILDKIRVCPLTFHCRQGDLPDVVDIEMLDAYLV